VLFADAADYAAADDFSFDDGLRRFLLLIFRYAAMICPLRHRFLRYGAPVYFFMLCKDAALFSIIAAGAPADARLVPADMLSPLRLDFAAKEMLDG